MNKKIKTTYQLTCDAYLKMVETGEAKNSSITSLETTDPTVINI